MLVTVNIVDKIIGGLKSELIISQTISAVCERANVCKCWIEWIHFNCFTRQEILKINEKWSARSRSLNFLESEFSVHRLHFKFTEISIDSHFLEYQKLTETCLLRSDVYIVWHLN